MRINRFEDLECWQEARGLTKTLCEFTKRPDFSRDYRLTDQLTGAAISIMNNICEGFDAQSNKEFVRFLNYSRRSCSEVQNCLYVASDQIYIAANEFRSTYDHCAKVRQIIDGLIRYLKQHQKNRPQKKAVGHPNDQPAQRTQRANRLTG